MKTIWAVQKNIIYQVKKLLCFIFVTFYSNIRSHCSRPNLHNLVFDFVNAIGMKNGCPNKHGGFKLSEGNGVPTAQLQPFFDRLSFI